jgi:hypothetical protein
MTGLLRRFAPRNGASTTCGSWKRRRETEHGHCGDTLVKKGDTCVFLGWNWCELPAKKYSGLRLIC